MKIKQASHWLAWWGHFGDQDMDATRQELTGLDALKNLPTGTSYKEEGLRHKSQSPFFTLPTSPCTKTGSFLDRKDILSEKRKKGTNV